jgi:hypothetical protein
VQTRGDKRCRGSLAAAEKKLAALKIDGVLAARMGQKERSRSPACVESDGEIVEQLSAVSSQFAVKIFVCGCERRDTMAVH